MEIGGSTSAAVMSGRQSVASEMVNQAIQSEQKQAQALNAMLQNSQEATRGSSTAPGVGGVVDRKV
ncbi:MAG: hypothetical protein KI785_08225 [Devosiaceae bacterium]|nr:hypothetical protein [Devosiaceae bacterium MH13]